MLIYIDYDNSCISKTEMQEFAINIEKIISQVTGFEEKTPTYINSYELVINAFPVEIYIKITKKYIDDIDLLMKNIKENVLKWKEENNFKHLINISIIPMDWLVEFDV